MKSKVVVSSLDFVVSGIVVVGPLFVNVGNVAEDVGGGVVELKVVFVASVVVVVSGRVVVDASEVVDFGTTAEDVGKVVVAAKVVVVSVVVLSDRDVVDASIF